MTVIRPNSISGITSITAQANEINVFRSDGTLAGLLLNGVNFNTTTGVSTFNNLDVGGVLTYQDVTNVDSVGIITARSTIDAQGAINLADSIIHTGDTDTAIRFPEADTITFETAGFEQARINNDVQMFIEGNSKPTKLQIHREDASINADDVIGQITFTGRDSGGDGTQRVGAAISAIASNGWDTGQATGYSATHLDFYTQAQQGAVSTLTPRLRILSDGNLQVPIGSNIEIGQTAAEW